MQLRKTLKYWNAQVFGNISKNLKDASERLVSCERQNDLYRDEDSKIRLHEARAVHTRLLALERGFWHQK